jgi:hypothetical protein
VTDSRTLDLEESFHSVLKQIDAISALLGSSSEPLAPETAEGIAIVLMGISGNARATLKATPLA